MASCVYRLRCKNQDITEFYIGSTNNLDLRTNRHNSDCKRSNARVYTFIRDTGGMDNWAFDIELLTEGIDRKTRKQIEQDYIDCLKPELNMMNAKGIDYNKKKDYNNNRYPKIKGELSKRVVCDDCNKEMNKSSLTRHKKYCINRFNEE